MSKFVLVGSTVFDMYAAALPYLPGSEAAEDEFDDRSLVHLPDPFVCSMGGNAGNTAFVLARLGHAVTLCSPLGDDLFADWLRERLQREGVRLVELEPRETSVNVVGSDAIGRRASLFRPVAPESATLVDTVSALAVAEGDRLLLAGYPHPDVEVMSALAAMAASRGATTALDVGPRLAGLTEDLLQDTLPHIDLLFANDAELVMLLGGNAQGRVSAAEMAGFARRRHLRVVAKHGIRGASIHDGQQTVEVPAFRCRRARITVGAGDAFNGGVMAAMTRTGSPAEALRYGAAVAVIVLERGIGMDGAPTVAEVDRYLADRDTT